MFNSNKLTKHINIEFHKTNQRFDGRHSISFNKYNTLSLGEVFDFEIDDKNC
jgi:hypothetical protein